MSNSVNGENIDIIMAEMEAFEKAPKPKARTKSADEFIEKIPEEEKVFDDVDANRINSTTDASRTDVNQFISSLFTKKPEKPGKLFPSKPTQERYYDTANDNIGIALIFNQVNFKGEKARAGSYKDANDLENVLSEIGFQVTVFTDLEVNEIEKALLAVSKHDHTDNDCLLVTIMTHGKQDGKVFAKDREFHVQDLWEFFLGNSCPTLIGKPKLFFIQACRGSMTDPGIAYKPKPKMRMICTDTVDAKAFKEEVYVIPTLADLLVMYSTAEGFYSFRNPADGSWFIQAICEELRENLQDDLMTILTGVNRRVAFAKQSCVPDIDDWDAMKQMPNVVSMLTKTFYFRKRTQKWQLETA